jgi:hypothetical protein
MDVQLHCGQSSLIFIATGSLVYPSYCTILVQVVMGILSEIIRCIIVFTSYIPWLFIFLFSLNLFFAFPHLITHLAGLW